MTRRNKVSPAASVGLRDVCKSDAGCHMMSQTGRDRSTCLGGGASGGTSPHDTSLPPPFFQTENWSMPVVYALFEQLWYIVDAPGPARH